MYIVYILNIMTPLILPSTLPILISQITSVAPTCVCHRRDFSGQEESEQQA